MKTPIRIQLKCKATKIYSGQIDDVKSSNGEQNKKKINTQCEELKT